MLGARPSGRHISARTWPWSPAWCRSASTAGAISPTLTARLAQLKQTSSWQGREIVEAGGWVTLPGNDRPNGQLASACADTLNGIRSLQGRARSWADAVIGRCGKRMAKWRRHGPCALIGPRRCWCARRPVGLIIVWRRTAFLERPSEGPMWTQAQAIVAGLTVGAILGVVTEMYIGSALIGPLVEASAAPAASSTPSGDGAAAPSR